MAKRPSWRERQERNLPGAAPHAAGRAATRLARANCFQTAAGIPPRIPRTIEPARSITPAGLDSNSSELSSRRCHPEDDGARCRLQGSLSTPAGLLSTSFFARLAPDSDGARRAPGSRAAGDLPVPRRLYAATGGNRKKRHALAVVISASRDGSTPRSWARNATTYCT